MSSNPQLPSIPHSQENEEAVIGSVLINPDAFPDIAEFVKPGDFYIHRNRWIWEAMCALTEKRVPIDLLTLADQLERTGQLSEIGGRAHLTSLTNATPSSINAVQYARNVTTLSVRRQMIEAASKIAAIGYNDDLTAEQAKALMWQYVEAVASKMETRGLKHMGTFMGTIFEHVDKWSRLTELPGVPSGFMDLDHVLGNMQADNLLVLAGRPGQGKTALLTDIAYHSGYMPNAPAPRKVAFFSLEMSSEEVAMRMLSKHSGINSLNMRTGKLAENEWAIFTHSIEAMSNGTGIYIDDTPSISPMQILARAKALRARAGLDLVIVDYIQLAQGDGENENRTQEVSYVSRTLKLIAKELHVPVLAAAQMGRAVEQRSNKVPRLSDLRESGSIEQDADVVMFIYKDPDPAKKKDNVVQIVVAKQRNGPQGVISLVWRPTLTKFESAAFQQALPQPEDVEPSWLEQENMGGG